MQIKLIKKEASKRLKKNIGKAISILFISLASVICVTLISQVLTVYFDTVLINSSFKIDTSLNALIVTGITLLVSLLLLTPLCLNVKKWYMSIKTMDSQLHEAFSIFGSFKAYVSSVWYGIIKFLLISVIYFLLSLPAMIAAIALRIHVESNNNNIGITFAILFAVMVSFIVISIFYGIYVALGFFYADYIYLSKVATNPIKAIKLSMKMSRNQRGAIAFLYISLLPYLLLCVFVVPILFVIPYIKSILAFYAKEKLISSDI